ncbi:MAG: hypothetical protein FH749_00260 [Firmicutes bacterium]|nr:hypothetical protein [Bacillota bacterium]
MHEKPSQEFRRSLMRMITLLVLALFVYRGLALVVANYWLLLALGFLVVKIARDILFWMITRKNPFFFFEDYLKDTAQYMLVAAIGIGIVYLILTYVGGMVWEPVLIAALAWVWR